MQDKKHIVITIDKKYSTYSAIMLYSLLSNNDPAQYHIHIIKDFNNAILEIPIKYVLKKHKCTHTFYSISSEDIELKDDLLISDHISVATYFRLFLPKLIQDINEILFLDSDIIVDGNIEELFNTTKLKDVALAAVIIDNEERKNVLQLTRAYFNAGVMFLNLSYLKANNYMPKFVAFQKQNKEKIHFWDQDILNAVVNDNYVSLNDKWNYISPEQHPNSPPIIIHYAGIHKPWTFLSKHPLKHKYFEYATKDKFLWLINSVIQKYDALKRKLNIEI